MYWNYIKNYVRTGPVFGQVFTNFSSRYTVIEYLLVAHWSDLTSYVIWVIPLNLPWRVKNPIKRYGVQHSTVTQKANACRLHIITTHRHSVLTYKFSVVQCMDSHQTTLYQTLLAGREQGNWDTVDCSRWTCAKFRFHLPKEYLFKSFSNRWPHASSYWRLNAKKPVPLVY
jgi:hypothetical protein